ncbi:MAG: Coenzyme F420 hydrogenase/dehydrogenase, beta subunit C-terminal domain [Candidatus Jordarchaeum sp.]|uniref:Coenzyme F420 hydrogenase/dehydrogenase, beta subunit C-terminal domain n=1 Tax=Candidatus Jordarchaeum sp. TaxID=2823881 RepID=UPI00404B11CB
MYKDLERDVIKAGKCVLCGTCVSACPNDVLKVDEWGKRIVSVGKCPMGCTVCTDMCIGLHPIQVDPIEIFGNFKEVIQVQSLMTNVKQYSYFQYQRFYPDLGGIAKPKSGVVSTILIHLLEENIIDCAVVAGRRQDDPWRSSPAIATTDKEVLYASGTKPFQCPTNAALIDAIVNFDRVALVGLPCHIEGARRLAQKYLEFRETLKYLIGIPCGTVFSAELLTKQALEMGVDIERIVAVDFDNEVFKEENPIKNLGMFIVTDDGKRYPMSLSEFKATMAKECISCKDFAAEYSDLSVATLAAPVGWSTVFIRNEKGKEIIENMVSKGLLLQRPFNYEKIEDKAKLEAQAEMVWLKSSPKTWMSMVTQALMKRQRTYY